MAFEPDYGETLLTEEERDALTPEARELLGDPIRKADLYDLEQQIQDEVADDLVGGVLDAKPGANRTAWHHRSTLIHWCRYRSDSRLDLALSCSSTL